MAGAREVLSAFANDPAIDLFVVWIPMLPSDDRAAAERGAERFRGSRARLFWDERRRLGAAVGDTLLDDAISIAWDVYLAYAPGQRRGEAPRAWIHQLGNADRARFRGGRLREGLGELRAALR